jgi:hypothetical protein
MIHAEVHVGARFFFQAEEQFFGDSLAGITETRQRIQ